MATEEAKGELLFPNFIKLGEKFGDNERWEHAVTAYSAALELNPNHMDTQSKLMFAKNQIEAVNPVEENDGNSTTAVPYPVPSVFRPVSEILVPVHSLNSGRESKAVEFVPADNIAGIIQLLEESRENRRKNGIFITDEQKKSADSWKVRGNGLFSKEQYKEAIHAYTEALKCNPDDLNIRCNRALQYLKLEMYWEAIVDASVVLHWDELAMKAAYRLATGYNGVGKYPEAVKVLEAIISKLGGVKSKEKESLTDLLNQCRLFVKQEETGQGYDHAVEYGKPAADFTKRVMVVRFGEGSRVGVVATEDIPRGQLVLMAKAINIITVMDDEYQGQFRYGHPDIMECVKSKPHLKLVLHHLYGELRGKVKSEDDVFTRIWQEKMFQERVDNHGFPITNSEPFESLSADGIATPNSMVYGVKSGLWQIPSYIRHSCWDGNALWRIHGDFIIITALKPIRKGDEIRMNMKEKMNLMEPLARRCLLQSRSLDSCTCSLCELDRSESPEIHHRRREIIYEIQRRHQTSVARTLELWDELENLRASNPNLNVPLLKVVDDVMFKLITEADDFEDKVRQLKIRAYDLTVTTPLAYHAFDYISKAYLCARAIKNIEAAAQLKKKYKTAFFMMYGFRSQTGLSNCKNCKKAGK